MRLIINMSISIESNDLHETVMQYSIGTLIRLHHNMYVIVGTTQGVPNSSKSRIIGEPRLPVNECVE